MNQPKAKDVIQADPVIEKLVAKELQRLGSSIMAQIQVAGPQLVAEITFYLAGQGQKKNKSEVGKGDTDAKKQ